MKINEIFYSIQGEGRNVGLPTIFVRTTGCNLRCPYCDTAYAYYEGEEISLQEILKKIKKWDCKRICLTGGEPLLQDELPELIDMLLSEGYKISIETNGSIDISEIAKKDVIISMDIKCPSSGMYKKMNVDNISLLRSHDELKFIIGDMEDYRYAKEMIKKHVPGCEVIMQPVWGKAKKLAEWILEDGLNVRLSIQIHKILWGNGKGI
ncbi:MAG: radical SAM protein [Candidatus Thermoplasmatota archaeon]|nr:radical SAM protein [Candidatus Thermoplasmatota archaeon]